MKHRGSATPHASDSQTGQTPTNEENEGLDLPHPLLLPSLPIWHLAELKFSVKMSQAYRLKKMLISDIDTPKPYIHLIKKYIQKTEYLTSN